MSKLDNFQDRLMELTSKIQSNIYINAVSSGLMGSMGVLIAGTIINIIVNLPIPAFTEFLTNIGLLSFMQAVVKTFQLTTPLTCFLIAHSLAKSKGCDPVQAGIAAFMSYMLMVPAAFDESGNGTLAFSSMTADNIATAIIVGLISSALFCWSVKKNFVIKLPDSIPEFVKKSLSSIPAACITVFPFIILRYIFSLTSFATLPGFITSVIAAPLGGLGNTLAGHLVFLFMSSFVWWFGIHNASVITVAMIVMMPSAQENIMAVMSNQPAPHMLSMWSFLVIMQLLGGGGCTVGLALDTVLFAKSDRYKAQGKLQLIPSLFNINEPAMFGMPVILNPIFFVPYVFGPLLIYILFYLCLSMGLFTTPITMVNSYLPGALQGFLLGGGVGLGIFMIVATLISCVTWLPFLLIADKNELKAEKAMVE